MNPEIIALLTIGGTLLGALGGAYFRGRNRAHGERDQLDKGRERQDQALAMIAGQVAGKADRLEDSRERERDRMTEASARYRDEMRQEMASSRGENRAIIKDLGDVRVNIGKIEASVASLAEHGSGKHEQIRTDVMIWLERAFGAFRSELKAEVRLEWEKWLEERGTK